MAYLVDTNVLLRLALPEQPLHEAALAAITVIDRRGEAMYACAQNFIELWNVATRPKRANGLGRTPDQAADILRQLELAFPRLGELPETYDRWRELVLRFGVSGVQVHDARLVAVMLANNVVSIVTFNTKDFERYRDVGIRPCHPDDITTR